jgi:hypothetical protein
MEIVGPDRNPVAWSQVLFCDPAAIDRSAVGTHKIAYERLPIKAPYYCVLTADGGVIETYVAIFPASDRGASGFQRDIRNHTTMIHHYKFHLSAP